MVVENVENLIFSEIKSNMLCYIKIVKEKIGDGNNSRGIDFFMVMVIRRKLEDV